MATKKKAAKPKPKTKAKSTAKAKAPAVTPEDILGMRRAEFRAFEAKASFDDQPKDVQRAMLRKSLWLDILDESRRAASTPVRWF